MSDTDSPTAPFASVARRPLICRERLPDEGPRGYLLWLAERNLVSALDVLKVLGVEAVGFTRRGRNGPSSTQVYQELREACRFCPRCLASRHAWFDGWEISFADACALCGAWLVDTCSRCGSQVRWTRKRLMVCDCGGLLSSEVAREAPSAVSRLASSLVALQRGGSPELPPLSGCSLSQAQQIASLLGRLAHAPNDDCRIGPGRLRPLCETWPTTAAAAEVLADWPGAFCRVLDACRDRMPKDDHGSLLRCFPTLYNALYRQTGSSQRQLVRDAFEGYVLERWPGQVAKRHRRLSDCDLVESSWLRPRQAGQLTGYPRRLLQSLAESGEIESRSWVTARGRTFVLLRRESIEALQATHGFSIDLSAAAVRLGLHESRLAEILPILCSGAAPPANQGGRWVIPLRWLEQWEGILGQQVSMEQPPSGSVTLHAGLRYEVPDSHTFAALLKAVQEGHLPVLGRVQSFPGLQGLVFDRSRLQEWLLGNRSRPATLSLRATACLLDIKEEVVYFLARRGLLKTHQVRSGRKRESHVSEQTLEDFQQTYLFASSLARNRRTSSRAIQKFLQSTGVSPVAGPGVDRCRQLVYRRDDVEKAFEHCGLPVVNRDLRQMRSPTPAQNMKTTRSLNKAGEPGSPSSANSGSVLKPIELICCPPGQRLSLQQRRLLTVVCQFVHSNGVTSSEELVIPRDLMQRAVDDQTAGIQSMCAGAIRLTQHQALLNPFDPCGPPRTVRIAEFASIQGGSFVLRLSPEVFHAIRSSDRFAEIDLKIMNGIRGVNDLALYEICAAFQSEGETPPLSLAAWSQYMRGHGGKTEAALATNNPLARSIMRLRASVGIELSLVSRVTGHRESLALMRADTTGGPEQLDR